MFPKRGNQTKKCALTSKVLNIRLRWWRLMPHKGPELEADSSHITSVGDLKEDISLFNCVQPSLASLKRRTL